MALEKSKKGQQLDLPTPELVLQKIEEYSQRYKSSRPKRLDNPAIHLDTLMLEFRINKPTLIFLLKELEADNKVSLIVNDLANSKKRKTVLGTVQLI